MFAQTHQDLVTSISPDIAGLSVPANISHLKANQLRVENGIVIDITSRANFHIDVSGRKHVDPAFGSQQLTCNWDDELIEDTGTWRVKTVADYTADIIKRYAKELDAIADEVYTASSSRATRYEHKHKEAVAYKAASYPASPSANDYPYLVKEAAERSVSEQVLADLIIAAAATYDGFGAEMEALRAKLSVDVSAQSTESTMEVAAQAIIASAKSLAAPLLS